MKPVNLKIKGLNSFVEQQTIEFSKLTEKGLFGIFGPTASGKSTILDGITIALYGKVSRETKEFVNTETNVLEISYDFEIGLGKARKLYRAERCIKRLKTGNFKTTYARLIEINKENPEESKILAEGPKDVEENIVGIIGLKVEDFTRSVVLPQGKFNEFLKLTGKDRRSMLERIFALEKYGTKLYDKIRAIRNENLKTQSELEGEMKGYENVSVEAQKEIQAALDDLKEEEKQLKVQKNTLDNQYTEYKTLWDIQEEKNQYIKRQRQLQENEEEIKSKRESFTKGRLALNVKPFIDNVAETKESLSVNKTALEKISSDFKVTCERLNNTKASYEEAFNNKNNKLPILIEKEANLKQAIVIEEKIAYIASEKNILLEKHKELMININKNTLSHNSLETNKAKLEIQIEMVEESLSKTEVLPEYREKLQNTYNSELEVASTQKNVEELKSKDSILKKDIDTTSTMYKEAILLQASIQNKLVVLQEKGNTIANNFPGDNNLLLEKQKDYSTLQDNLEKAVENRKIKEELQKKYNIINIESEKLKLNLKNTEEVIELSVAQIKAIDEEIKLIEQEAMAAVLAYDLKEGDPCPVCGSNQHPHSAKAIVNDTLEVKKSLKQREELNLEKIRKDFHMEQIKAAELLRDQENINGQLAIVCEKLGDINIEEMRAQKSESEVALLKFKGDLESYNKQKTELDLALIALREEKSKADSSEAKLGEGLKKEKEAHASNDKELSIATEKLKLLQENYELLKEELYKAENSLAKEPINGTTPLSIKEKLQQVKAADNDAVKLIAIARKHRAELVTTEKQRLEVDQILKDLNTKKAEIETSGKEKKAEIEGLTSQAMELCGFTTSLEFANSKEFSPKVEIQKTRDEIKEITLREARLRELLEKENIEKQGLETQKITQEKKGEMLITLLEQGEERLNLSLKENFFEDSETAYSYLISKEVMIIIEEEIKKYEEAVRSVLDNLQRVEKLLKGKEIDPVFFEGLKKQREIVQNILEEKSKAIGAQTLSLEDMGRKIEEIKALVIKRREIDHKLSLLRELDTLIQGNKFVEYVAMKQLKYISMEASKRLKDITRGRYALELDSEGAFVMRDDFNGGRRRETNTLSGGETFLTSLCLALALSSQIQMKGSAPLEFFFLDEGFGTLDTELLDIVMNSLEKLHSSTLSVGIISHVEELKNRVPIKLIVTPAEQGQGGSKVKLEYS
ncbi:AAA family ATPase [Clostridium sp. CS001]|uniref:AAA family ATPase n=1 Tax=Clostridium sp. CS001 TaxID=2880648 RepID=UPI001CF2E6E2|nr:AAA family ATPase [Clostridium sp. CS001]MCB2290004.1 AAA family ATPase [Clostridium sp. CS001]